MTTNRPLHCHRDDDSDDINKDGANVDNEHKEPVVVICEKLHLLTIDCSTFHRISTTIADCADLLKLLVIVTFPNLYTYLEPVKGRNVGHIYFIRYFAQHLIVCTLRSWGRHHLGLSSEWGVIHISEPQPEQRQSIFGHSVKCIVFNTLVCSHSKVYPLSSGHPQLKAPKPEWR